MFKEQIDVLFYDVTTLYFESFEADELREFGYSKDCKFKETQIMLALVATTDGLPFGVRDTAQADHVDSLAEFGGRIYVSLANRSGSPQGTLIFHSASGDPGSWEDALADAGAGFGKPQNENFKDMQVFDGQLCGGTWNETGGAWGW